jgi:hypothetical protein
MKSYSKRGEMPKAGHEGGFKARELREGVIFFMAGEEGRKERRRTFFVVWGRLSTEMTLQ